MFTRHLQVTNKAIITSSWKKTYEKYLTLACTFAGIGNFFRDLSARTLTVDVIRQLDENIPILMCNLEKIFPPSFFDVMEHLVVHLPYEALLRGPVHNRWMYP